MNEVILPPSPNSHYSTILACANNGTVCWGARNIIVVAKPNKKYESINYSFIDKAHIKFVTTLSFLPDGEDGILRLVSGGFDNVVRIWNLNNLKMEQENSELDPSDRVVAVDCFKQNAHLIAYISNSKSLRIWNIKSNSTKLINLDKLTPTCLSCCPHDGCIVSIGTKCGLVCVIDIQGSGFVKHRLGKDGPEIHSLSWCPVPVNVLKTKKEKEYLLASGSKDGKIIIWRTKTVGKCQFEWKLPKAPSITTQDNFTRILWIKPQILVSNMLLGKLVLWDFSKKVNKRTPEFIHNKHSDLIYCIAVPVDNTDETDENGQIQNSSTANNIKSIWTVSLDKQIICCNLTNNQTCFDYIIASQRGHVSSLDISPIDRTQIAMGVNDSFIRRWDVSKTCEPILIPQMLLTAKEGAATALAWHPKKPNILAFATTKGYVGVFDIYSKNPLTLYMYYENDVVYSIGWGPAPDVHDLALYACVNKNLIYYNPEDIRDTPKSVKTKDCTEFSWKSDKSLLAIGFLNGSIFFYNRDLSQCGSMMCVLSKPIRVLKWHPINTLADVNNDFSEMKNYLAVAVNSPTITIFNIVINNSENESEKLTSKTVAVLNGHKKKVASLAWSPHISGYLASGSYDHTVKVWKIHTSGNYDMLYTYERHLQTVQCCMWSPLSHNFIISGSSDFTVQIWTYNKDELIDRLNTAISEALCNNDYNAAKSIIKTNSLIKYREIEVEIFNELNEIQMNVNNNEICKWLKGEATNLSILDKISEQFNERPKEYFSLSNVQEVSDSESNITLIQIQASRQIGLSILSNEKKQKIAHLLKAADIIYKFEKSSVEKKRFLLIKYLYAFDTRKLTDCNSIYNYNENEFGANLRAYLCCALVSWYGPDSHLTSEEKSKILETFITIFKKCVLDFLSSESVMYWMFIHEVKEIGEEIPSLMRDIKSNPHVVFTNFTTCEKFSYMVQRRAFLKKKLSTLTAKFLHLFPSPFNHFAVIMEVINNINNVKKKRDLRNFFIYTIVSSYTMIKINISKLEK